MGARAVSEYDGDALTAQLPVTAVAESLVATTETSLTEATLGGSTVTLTLNGRIFASRYNVYNALTVSGIEGVSFDKFDVDRISDTRVTVPLTFSGNIDADGTLTLTLGADAIVGYNEAIAVQVPVTAVEESLVATTEAPLTEATLSGSVVTLTLSGRSFVEYSRDPIITISGIEGVNIARYGIERVSATKMTVALTFSGNIDNDATLTIAVGANAITSYNKGFTVQLPVTAVEESLVTTTEAPLTELTLHGSVVTLTLSGRNFTTAWSIADALSVTGIEGVSVSRYGVGSCEQYRSDSCSDFYRRL